MSSVAYVSPGMGPSLAASWASLRLITQRDSGSSTAFSTEWAAAVGQWPPINHEGGCCSGKTANSFQPVAARLPALLGRTPDFEGPSNQLGVGGGVGSVSEEPVLVLTLRGSQGPHNWPSLTLHPHRKCGIVSQKVTEMGGPQIPRQ